jgi:hypothetical protein
LRNCEQSIGGEGSVDVHTVIVQEVGDAIAKGHLAEAYLAGIDACLAVTALGVVEVIEIGTFALTPANDAIYGELDFSSVRTSRKAAAN